MRNFLGSKNNREMLHNALFSIALAALTVVLLVQILPNLLAPPERRVGGTSTSIAITGDRQSLAQGEK